MRAVLIGDETYDKPPPLGKGVLVGIKGVVHVVRANLGIRVQMFCADEGTWTQYKTLEQGWFEVPTCVKCAIHSGAARARFFELQWRVEWWQRERESNLLATPRKVASTL